MEILVWMMFYQTPEVWECTGCFQKLNTHTPHGMDKPSSWTRQDNREGGDRRRKRRQGGSSRCEDDRERQQVRREREGRREGGRKKEKGPDEAGVTSTELHYVYVSIQAVWSLLA